ncbi:MAG TPA: DUF1707 domain-containing protein [Streptosporangiaceae bacterium]|nr:DUF1707 domain-containing protein [Streptosporangiaceae bacterium]
MAQLIREGRDIMSSPAGPPQQTGPALRRAGWADAQIRVSDAERMAIADRLAKHFVDGRLSETEFDERLDRAMRATTMADLTGLLSDLPDDEPAQPELPATARRDQRRMLKVQLERERLHLKHERRRQRRAARNHRTRSLGPVLVVAAALIGLIIVGHILTHSIGAWLLLGLIAFLWLRREDSRYHGS